MLQDSYRYRAAPVLATISHLEVLDLVLLLSQKTPKLSELFFSFSFLCSGEDIGKAECRPDVCRKLADVQQPWIHAPQRQRGKL